MQKCCDTPIGQPRQVFDQLFIRIKKVVTGRLDIVGISECEWLRDRNGRADSHRLLSIRRKPRNVASTQKPLELRLELRSDSRLSDKKFSLT